MTTIIRPLQQADAAGLAKDCFPDLAPEDVLDAVREDLALQEAGQGITLIAAEDGRVGVHAKLLKQGDSGWVFNVASHPDFRGRGIVQDLLVEMARRARAMGMVRLLAHVRADNRRARRAYEKAGFRSVGQDGMRGEQLRYELDIFS